MNHWHKYPLVRITIPFALGLLAAIKTPPAESNLLLGIAGFVILLLVFSYLFHSRISYTSRYVFGVAVSIAFLLTGFLWQNVHTRYQNYRHFSDYLKGHEMMSGIIVQEPEEKANSYKTILKVQRLYSGSSSKTVKGRLLTYLGKDSLSSRLSYGDRILFKGYLNPIDPPKNPEVFDYKQYMSLRHIYHQIYIPPGSMKTLAGKQRNTIRTFSVESRQKLASILEEYNLRGDDYALATALVLGYDRYLGDDLRQAYTGAGAMHVLCVSGLHVGIMYVVIAFLLNQVPLKGRGYRVLKVLLTLLVIWLYALITGLEPAVTRASTMFSFVALGRLFRRKSRIYNTLAASALVMLLINPNQIAYVGFQMSFLAVTGIVWLQPVIYNWWRPRSWLPDKIWALVSVSIAAQLILFPLLVYYFHKVSLIFIATNIIAIPLATLIIYSTLALFAFSGLAMIGNVLASWLAALIKALNHSVAFLSELPGAYVESLWISQPQMMLLYLAMISLVFSLIYAKKRVVITSISFAIIIFGSFLIKQHTILLQDKFILYHAKEGLAMDFINGRKNVFLGDSAVMNNSDLVNYNFRNVWEKYRLETAKIELPKTTNEIRKNEILMRYPFISFNGEVFTILKDSELPQDYKLTTDFLIISGKPWLDKKIITSKLEVKKRVLFDGTNPSWYIKKVKPLFEEAGFTCYATSESGAFIRQL